ncbi:MAG: ion transporter, partial [Bacteroidota bacterium]
TLEYLLRIFSVRRPWGYILSFFGIVDLLSILPTFLSLFISGSQYLITIRALRLLRIFRIFKLGNYLTQSEILLSALRASRIKIVVFLGAVLASVIIIGSLMYLVEGGAGSGFNSIPESIYWAIVTITTVGYGDIAPVTPLGKFLSSILMILGYGIIAVPTGIVSVELAQAESQAKAKANTRTCENCARTGHDLDAVYCKYCGEAM